MGNRFLELLETCDLEVYLFNTGTVGGAEGDELAKKVRISTSAAVQEGIIDRSIEWMTDPDFGYQIAASIPGIDDVELLQPVKLYERQGRADEYREIVAQVKQQRRDYLASFKAVDPRVAAGIGG